MRIRPVLQSVIEPVQSFTVPNLNNGITWFFRVSARNAVGDSDWSGEARALPQAAVPGGVGVITAHTRESAVFVEWSEAVEFGEAITGYTVQWKSGVQDYSNGRSSTAVDNELLVGGAGEWNGVYFSGSGEFAEAGVVNGRVMRAQHRSRHRFGLMRLR